MIIKLYVNITFFNGEYILVSDKHKFKLVHLTLIRSLLNV